MKNEKFKIKNAKCKELADARSGTGYWKENGRINAELRRAVGYGECRRFESARALAHSKSLAQLRDGR
jgi:hypothetical protein